MGWEFGHSGEERRGTCLARKRACLQFQESSQSGPKWGARERAELRLQLLTIPVVVIGFVALVE